MELLLCGYSITAAAVGLGRRTVHRWLATDFELVAELNSRRRELREEVEAKLLALGSAATSTIAEALAKGDVRAALAVLRGIGVLPGGAMPREECDPDELRRRADDRREERETARLLRRFSAP